MIRTDKTRAVQNVYPATLANPRRTRGVGNVWKHLRTFRQHLFARIRDVDLRWSGARGDECVHAHAGAYYTDGWDWSFMLPIVESSFHPVERTRTLYLYEPFQCGDAELFQARRRRIDAAVADIVAKACYAKTRPCIAVIGDASLDSTKDAKASLKRSMAIELGRLLALAGYNILTGGMGGVMEAVSEGAHMVGDSDTLDAANRGRVIGLLPGGDPSTANVFVDVLLPTSMSHARNALVAQADAVVVVGGGAGTLSELGIAWASARMCITLAPMLTGGSTTSLVGKRIDERQRIPADFDSHSTQPSSLESDCFFQANSPALVLELLHTHLHRYASRHRSSIRIKSKL